LTLDQFSSLFQSCDRLSAREQTEHAWLMMTAAQGTEKGMKKFLGNATRLLLGTPEGNDKAAFNARVGKGF
jgi:hypothetical protein